MIFLCNVMGIISRWRYSIICFRLTFLEIPHKFFWGVLRGAFSGFGCPKRHPDALLAKTLLNHTPLASRPQLPHSHTRRIQELSGAKQSLSIYNMAKPVTTTEQNTMLLEKSYSCHSRHATEPWKPRKNFNESHYIYTQWGSLLLYWR